MHHTRYSTSKLFLASALPTLAVLLAAPAQAQTTVSAYLSAPNRQTVPATITGAVSETFAGLSTGVKNYTPASPFSSSIGNYVGAFDISPDDQYGTGTGNYLEIGVQSGSVTPVTLTFANPINYFGMSYNAGDRNNGFTFYDAQDNFIGRYSTSDLVTVLNGGQGTVTALDGSIYNANEYYGKPNGNGPGFANTGLNTAEPYAFLNFFIEGGTVGRIVFDNSGSTTTGFESDNHTISLTSQSPAGGQYVFVGTASAAPEPGSIALLLMAGVPVVGILRRRKKN